MWRFHGEEDLLAVSSALSNVQCQKSAFATRSEQTYGLLHVQFVCSTECSTVCNREVIDVSRRFRLSRGFEPIQETSVVTRRFQFHGCCENLLAARVPCLRCAFPWRTEATSHMRAPILLQRLNLLSVPSGFTGAWWKAPLQSPKTATCPFSIRCTMLHVVIRALHP